MMSKTLAFVAVLALVAASAAATTHFQEVFDDSYDERWTVSSAADEETRGAFVHTAGEWYADEDNKGVQTSQDARFYQLSAPFESFDFASGDLVLQYSLKQERTVDCGGAYIKVLRAGFDASAFNGDTDYAIMFGPDVCGANKRIHAIFNYKGENLEWKKRPTPEGDKLTHVYTLIVHAADSTYEVLVDNEVKESGSLTEDWDFLAPETIKDPAVSKPEDWVDSPMMDDPEDVKPDDWDVPSMLPDEEAEKPEDWDDEDDGEWERPMTPNPDFKGPWQPKRVDNPAYKGPWEEHHPVIANPEYVADDAVHAQAGMGGVGIELWQVVSGSLFDNIYLGDDIDEARKQAAAVIDASAAEQTMFDAAEEIRVEAERVEREAAQAEAAAAAAAAADDEDADFDADFADDDDEL